MFPALVQRLDLGLDGLAGLALQRAIRAPVKERKQSQHRDAEQQRVQQRQTEGRGCEKPVANRLSPGWGRFGHGFRHA
jgi:hypothetical protein